MPLLGSPFTPILQTRQHCCPPQSSVPICAGITLSVISPISFVSARCRFRIPASPAQSSSSLRPSPQFVSIIPCIFHVSDATANFHFSLFCVFDAAAPYHMLRWLLYSSFCIFSVTVLTYLLLPFGFPAISITVIIRPLLKVPRVCLYYTLLNLGMPPFLHHFFYRKSLCHTMIYLDLISLTPPLLCSVTITLSSTLFAALFRSSYYLAPHLFSLSPQLLFLLLAAPICSALPIFRYNSKYSLRTITIAKFVYRRYSLIVV